jgi:hypothetical protein
VLRLVGLFLTFALGTGGFVAVDYTMAKRRASAEDSEGLTFTEYLGGLSSQLTQGLSSGDSGLPSALADMMPAAPEGWTVRPTVAKDIEVFLPKNRDDASADARKYVEAMGKARGASGVEVTILTYEKGERRVVIKAMRYPDRIFTSFTAMQQRMELQMRQPEYSSRDVMTVRGLDISEEFLPDGMRARHFMANVGAQIHLRILASKRMKDEDLVPFFQTLNVKAMNASVVDKHDGLGDVPVIVLASFLDDATRATYEADIAARKESEAVKRESDRLAAEAEAKTAEETQANGSSSGGEDGLIPKGDTSATTRSGACEKQAGSKFCSVDSN